MKKILLLLFPILLLAQENKPLGKPKESPSSLKGILHFADSLAAEKDYYRAITEYKRALFFFPNYPKKPWVQFEIGRMYFLGSRFEVAKKYFIPLTASQNPILKKQVRHWLALTYYENHDFLDAERLFLDLAKTAEGPTVDYEIFYGICLINQKKFLPAYKKFQEIEPKALKLDKKVYDPFFKESKKVLQEASKLRKKSPGWAVFWAILFPGGGHLYLGEWDNALISFLLVSSMGILAADGFIRDNLVQAGIFTTIGTGFYAGSIYSAYRQTKKHNLFLGRKEIKLLNQNFSKLNIAIRKRLNF
ncbi:MAG: hypothetical protein D6767_07980 [Candidatus Hydrogenedentota bacterium]|nr:MAG: hypothetical protein D6767_07980 [Candidatus Hydrogenedentota bacterium]